MSDEETRLMHELEVSGVRSGRRATVVMALGCAALLLVLWFAGSVAGSTADHSHHRLEAWGVVLGVVAALGLVASLIGFVRSTVWLARNARRRDQLAPTTPSRL